MPYKDIKKTRECWKRWYLRQKDSEEWKKYDREKAKKNYLKNKEKRIKQFKDYYNKNKEKINANNRLNYSVKKRTPKEKIDNNISYQIWRFLKEKKSGKKWESLVGYSLDSLFNHLEKQFDDKMTWKNYGSYWHVDHIIPRSFFKFETINDEEFKRCWSLENLRPLEKIENMKKGNKINLDISKKGE